MTTSARDQINQTATANEWHIDQTPHQSETCYSKESAVVVVYYTSTGAVAAVSSPRWHMGGVTGDAFAQVMGLLQED